MDLNNKKTSGVKERESLKCWGCGEHHLLRDYSHNPRSIQNIQDVQKVTTLNDILRYIPRISAALEAKQEEHQPTMIKIKGTILSKYVFVLIDQGASLSDISPQVVEKCKL